MTNLGLALRVLHRHPGFSVAVVATVAVVIAINATVFAAVNAILLKPLPYAHSDQLVRLAENVPADESPSGHAERVVGMKSFSRERKPVRIELSPSLDGPWRENSSEEKGDCD